MAQGKEAAVAHHYNVNGLGAKILDALRSSGLDLGALKPADLAPVDEFHMGGRTATAHVIGLMELPTAARVLDMGSGLGGVARYLAAECGCFAAGIDITPEFVRVAEMLTELTGLNDRVNFRIGSALDLPWPAANCYAATTFHMAMNIADRPRLYAEIARVVRPGGVLAIYDVMKGPNEGMVFPVPWAETGETSFLVTPAEMRKLLSEAGFAVICEEECRENALEHQHARLAQVMADKGPPPLGLHLLTGKTSGVKSRNMLNMLQAHQITLAIIIARRGD